MLRLIVLCTYFVIFLNRDRSASEFGPLAVSELALGSAICDAFLQIWLRIELMPFRKIDSREKCPSPWLHERTCKREKLGLLALQLRLDCLQNYLCHLSEY